MQKRVEKGMFDRFPQKLDKRFSIERLKVLGEMTFAGTSNPIDAEKWLSLVEKCFRMMDYLKERKVKLATFLLQDNIKDWWILHTT